MEFLGVLKKEHVENQGVNLKKLEFPGVFTKSPCEVSMVFGAFDLETLLYFSIVDELI